MYVYEGRQFLPKRIQSITNNKSLKEKKKIPVSLIFFRMGEEKVVMCIIFQ